MGTSPLVDIRPSESVTAANPYIFQSHGGFPSNKQFVFIDMVALGVRSGKPNPRSLLISTQFGFGPEKIDGPLPSALTVFLPTAPISDCLFGEALAWRSRKSSFQKPSAHQLSAAMADSPTHSSSPRLILSVFLTGNHANPGTRPRPQAPRFHSNCRTI